MTRRILKRLICHLINVGKQLLCGRLHRLLRQEDHHRPAHGLHRGIRRIARDAIHGQPHDSRAALSRLYRQFGKPLIPGRPEILCVGDGGQRSFAIGGKQDLTAPVDDAGISAVPQIHALDQVFHIIQIHPRASDTHQPAVRVNRDPAHDAEARRMRVLGDGGEIRLAGFSRALIPRTLFCLQRQELAGLIILFGRNIVSLHHEARFCSHIDRGHIILAVIDGQKHILDIPDQAKLLYDLRIRRIRVCRVKDLHGKRAVVFRVRKGDDPGRIMPRLVIDLLG